MRQKTRCFAPRTIAAYAFSHVNVQFEISAEIKPFQQVLTLYSKEKRTTQDKKDILGTKGTKQGHSAQKETIGRFEVFFYP